MLSVAEKSVRRTHRLPDGPTSVVTTTDPGTDSTRVLSGLISDYGDVVRYRTLFGEFTAVNHPDLAREVLCDHKYARNRLLQSVLGQGVLSSNGAQWENQRRLMLPAFQRQMIEPMVDMFRRVTVERTLQWGDAGADGRPVDITRVMNRIALSNIGLALFGTAFDDRFLDAFDCVMVELGSILNAATFGCPLVRSPDTNRRYAAAMETTEEAARELMSPHNGTQDALLMKILRHGQSQTGQPLSPTQVRDEILTMLTAGHETTAVALGWALLSLARNPWVQQRFYSEVDTVLGGRDVTAADIPKLTYTRMMLDEVLRLYPPVWLIARTAAEDSELGGYHVPANSGVLVSAFTLQRHAEYWDEPLRFDPERFAPGKKQPAPYSYIPFLAGRHICLGKHFALSELVVVLATLAQRYRFSLAHNRPVRFEPLLSLRIQGGLCLNVRPRGRGDDQC